MTSRVVVLAAARDDASADAIPAFRTLAGFRLDPGRAVRDRLVVYDTPEWGLLRGGLELSVRRRAGRSDARLSWIEVAARRFPERVERSAPATERPGGNLDPPGGRVGRRIAACVAGRPLRPVLEVERRRQVLRARDAEGLVAIVGVHTLRATVPGAARPPVVLHEVTLSMGGPRESRVSDLGRAMVRRFRLTAPAEPAAIRILRGTYGDTLVRPAPGLIGADDLVGDAARKMVARQLRRIRKEDPGVRAGRDVRSLHDLRVAVRRLREGLRVFRDGFPEAFLDHVRSEIAWLAPHLGEVRDLDVHIGRIGSGPVAALLRRRRLDRRDRMTTALQSSRYFALLALLDAFVLGMPVGEPVPERASRPLVDVAAEAIPRALRRVLDLGADSMASPKPKRLHRLRIGAKRLRYLVEFLGPVAGEAGRRLVREAVRLQDLLGDHQDAIVAGAVIEELQRSEEATRRPSLAAALQGRVVEESRRAAGLRARFVRTWPARGAALAVESDAILSALAGKKNGDAGVGVP